ncbi:hypothetical protein ZIOFF_024003 [Zingiber officinale]|uniref:Terpene synthase N-terminal domain-containing protein n=1 Tax=Zingiber officinale TaxID=94328 RepID=A0A8J5GSX1_ZINOF|nr:hypothetical protein ZIOFF_024003 [Zingiber officinale]
MELVDTPSLKAFEDVVVDRQVAGFDPSFWGDYFITNQKSQSEAWMNERAQELKNEVRSMFQNVTGILQTMNLIDTIQLLGLDYHFMEEIAKALDHLKDVDMSKYGLYDVALHFRLLRQKGFNISSGIYSMPTAPLPMTVAALLVSLTRSGDDAQVIGLSGRQQWPVSSERETAVVETAMEERKKGKKN